MTNQQFLEFLISKFDKLAPNYTDKEKDVVDTVNAVLHRVIEDFELLTKSPTSDQTIAEKFFRCQVKGCDKKLVRVKGSGLRCIISKHNK